MYTCTHTYDTKVFLFYKAIKEIVKDKAHFSSPRPPGLIDLLKDYTASHTFSANNLSAQCDSCHGQIINCAWRLFKIHGIRPHRTFKNHTITVHGIEGLD